MGKILKRCTICKKYQAVYLVKELEAGGPGRLCHACWMQFEAGRIQAGEKPCTHQAADSGHHRKEKTGSRVCKQL